MTNFIIHALPRSRTCWLSKFLTYKDYTCHHEMAMFFRKPEDYEEFFKRENTGTAETGVAQGWWLIQRACPGIKTVVIRRPLMESVDSVMNVDVSSVATYDREKVIKFLSYGNRMLDKIEKQEGVLSVDFHSLDKEDVIKSVFQHVLPYEFDHDHWLRFKDQNIQIDTKQLLLYRFAHKEEIDRFKMLCKEQLRHLRKTEPDNPIWRRV